MDIVGTILNATGMTFIVLGVILSTSYGWLVAKKPLVLGSFEIAPFGLAVTPFFIGIGILIVLYFFQFEERWVANGKDVILNPTIFGNHSFRNGVVDLFINLLVQAAVLYALPLFMLLFLELSSFETGLALMPFSISIIIFAIGGTRLTAKFLPNRLIQLGFLVAAVGLVVIVLMLDPAMSASTLFLGSFIAGAGFGLVVSQIVNLILSTVREDEISEVTGVNSTGEQLGNAIGVALIGSIMLNTLNSALVRSVTASSTLTAEVKSAVFSAAEQDIPLMSGSEVQALLAGVDAATQQELLSIYSNLYLTAFSAALLFLAPMAAIGHLIAKRLPSKRLVEEEPVAA